VAPWATICVHDIVASGMDSPAAPPFTTMPCSYVAARKPEWLRTHRATVPFTLLPVGTAHTTHLRSERRAYAMLPPHAPHLACLPLPPAPCYILRGDAGGLPLSTRTTAGMPPCRERTRDHVRAARWMRGLRPCLLTSCARAALACCCYRPYLTPPLCLCHTLRSRLSPHHCRSPAAA